MIITENAYPIRERTKKNVQAFINIHLNTSQEWQAVIWFANVNIHFSSTRAFIPFELHQGSSDLLLRFVYMEFQVECISRGVRAFSGPEKDGSSDTDNRDPLVTNGS